MKKINNYFPVLLNPILLIASVFLFAIDNPVLNWFIFVPVFFLIKKISVKKSFLYGSIYGFAGYFFYVNWLFSFSFTDLILVCCLYFVIDGLLFLLLKVLEQKSESFFYITGFILICCFDYLKTTGFAGFSYGLPVYSQYKNLILIQSANIAGVWALDFLMISCSALIFKIIENFLVGEGNVKIRILNALNKSLLKIIIFVFVFSSFIIYGSYSISHSKSDVSSSLRVACIQNNSDPWAENFSSYKKQIEKLISLTDQALKEDSSIELVIWPETAVIPAIEYNYYDSELTERKQLILRLLKYINTKKCRFVIGNFNSQKSSNDSGIINGYSSKNNYVNTKDYNSAYYFIPEKNVLPPVAESYSKIHLVPFSEYFPSFLSLFFNKKDLWTAGTDYKIFEYNDIKFATPICFEDNFGNDLRQFVLNGANLFITLSNDSWASSLKSQIQHLRMGVFRSVENAVPTIRCTVSGQTCCISSNGRIFDELKPFEENYLISEVHCNLKNGFTVYTLAGDFLPYTFLGMLFLIFLYNMIIALRKKIG